VQTAQTQVRIHNGETIAIGGMVKKADTTAETKVPILSDIPVIGLLFKNVEHNRDASDPTRLDLLIFLTVTLMEDDRATQQAVASIPPSG